MVTKQSTGGLHTDRPGDVENATEASSDPVAERAIDMNAQVVHLHCAMVWPEGLHCNSCRAYFRLWSVHVLHRAGWSDERIAALDPRAVL